MHRRLLLSLAILATALQLAPPALATELVTNGSFETGDLAGWQVYQELPLGGTADWFVTGEAYGPISGSPLDLAPAGSYQAVTDQGAASTLILYRDFAIPATLKAALRLTYWINNLAGGYTDTGNLYAGGPSNQKVRIDLQNPASYALLDQYGILENYVATGPATPAHVGATTITRDLTAYAGYTVRLRIAVVVTDNVLSLGIDDVSLEVSPFVPLVTNLETMHSGAAAWGDYDNDDDLDLAIGGATGDANLNVVYRHNSDESMSLSGISFPLLQQNAYAWGDYDNDGDLDLAMLGYGLEPQSEIYRNDGGTTFTPIGAGLIALADGAAAWGDYDHDGDLDLAINGQGGGLYAQCALYRNQGDDLFAPVAISVPGLRNGSIQWGDQDFDGHLDLLVCGYHTDIFSPYRLTEIYRGDGAGNFTGMSAGLTAVDDGMARWQDLNGDGYLDVALAGYDGGLPIARTFLYDPYLNSYFPSVTLTGVLGASLDCGDFDNDGDADLVVSGFTGTARVTSLYQNNGGGSFVEIGAGLPGVQNGVVLWADYDGDRDLDLLVAGNAGSSLISRVYRNTTAVANAAPSAPPLYGAIVRDEGVSFIWFSATDDHTVFPTYNLMVGSHAGGVDAVSPMANVSSGLRRIVNPGNTSAGGLAYLKFSGVGHGTVHWAVQAIDGSFAGGPFSPEQALVLGADVHSIADVPNDQGGRVRLTITRSQLDMTSRTQFPIIGYNVWRRLSAGAVANLVARDETPVDAVRATNLLRGPQRPGTAAATAPAAEAGAATASEVTDLPLLDWNGRHFVRGSSAALTSPFPPGTWELVGSFYSQQQSQYLYNSPTSADSGSGGPNWSAFVVTAHTTVPSVWFASEADSGKSVDNLAPASPLALTAGYHTGSGNTLQWQPAPEPDFENFRVYRGTSSGFVAGPGNLVASVTAPGFTDPAYDNATVFYKVSTTDHAGNESPAVAPGQTSAVDGPGLPTALALHAAAPSPFRAVTRLGFALPTAERVSLRVYDTAGRLVRTLADGDFAPGEHNVEWRGDDDAGRRVNAGVYFIRMEAGSFRATRRLLRM